MTNDITAAGLRTAQPAGVPERAQTLGQQEFLTLLTTQLRNQDPLSPMDNEAFVAQLAQFATVSGITEMNSSLAALAASQQRSAAANWLDQMVTGPDGETARVTSVHLGEDHALTLGLDSGATLALNQVRSIANATLQETDQ